MRFLSFLVVICLLIQAPVITHARDPQAVPLETGEAAPFDGVLVTPERIQELIGAEIERDELRVRIRTQGRLHEIEISEYERALNRKWYQQPRFNQVVGFSLGIIVFGGAVWGAGQLNK